MAAHPSTDTVYVPAPGRINTIGEHTDYNDGYVLPAAINRYVRLECRVNGTASTVNLEALDSGERLQSNLNDPLHAAAPWHRYIAGVALELQALNFPVRGFDVRFSGDIPPGAGSAHPLPSPAHRPWASVPFLNPACTNTPSLPQRLNPDYWSKKGIFFVFKTFYFKYLQTVSF